MKTIISIVCILFVALSVSAQVSHKNDPTYSTGNYKHPNKAKIAKDKQKGLEMKTIAGDDQTASSSYQTANRNYKMPNTKVTSKQQTILVLPSVTETEKSTAVQSNANYKRQDLHLKKKKVDKKNKPVIDEPAL
jgi:hypothetical protein